MINKIKKAIIWYHEQRFEYHKKRFMFAKEYENFLCENWKDFIS